MTITVNATYEDGVLKPSRPLPLNEHEQVRITIDSGANRARQTAGLMQWASSTELADRFALDPELSLEEA